MAKLLLLTHEFPPFLGGIGTYAAQMATAASGLGHDVTVVAPDYGRGPNLAEDDRARHPFRIARFPGGRYTERSLPRVLARVWAWTRGNHFDVVHAIDWPHLLALGLINRATRTPFLATAYGTDVLGPARSRLTRALGGGAVFESADRVLAISEFTRGLLLDHFPGMARRPVKVTPLGVASFWSGRADGLEALRTSYGIPPGDRVILTASRLDRRKGHRLTFRALALLPASAREATTFVIVGEGSDRAYRRELKDLADASGFRVVFTGRVDDETLRRFYATATVFCMPGEPHPKKVEGFGLVFLEAAAQGLPSVACDVGATAEVVRNGRNGLIVPPSDAEALSRALTRLLLDEALREELSREARSSAEAYTWDRCASQTYGLECIRSSSIAASPHLAGSPGHPGQSSLRSPR